MRHLSNNKIAALAVFILLFSLFFNTYIIMETSYATGSTTSGGVSMCINSPPTISYSCSSKAYVGKTYTCGMDAVRDEGENITFSDDTGLFDINSSTGIIRLTPGKSQTGSYEINITAEDDSGCSNNLDSAMFRLEIIRDYCGNGICSAGEDCSTCPEDCGVCPTEEAPSGGGGGGGGAASFDIDFTQVDSKIVTAYEDDSIIFTFNRITAHSLNVEEVEEGRIAVNVDSGREFIAGMEDERGIDMNNDGVDDISVYLISVGENMKAKFRVTQLEGAPAIKDGRIPLEATPESLKVLLVQGESFNKSLSIRNTGRFDFNIILSKEISLQGISLSEEEFLLPAGMSNEINIRFSSSEDTRPGVYRGHIFIEAVPRPATGDSIFMRVPVTVEVESRDLLFDASVEIPPRYREILPGEKVRATVTIFNLKSIRPVELNVDYIIKDSHGNIISREKETMSVGDQVSYTKEMFVPEGAKEGSYIFIVQTRYGESFSTTSESFFVGEGVAEGIEETKKEAEKAQSRYNTALFAGIGLMVVLTVLLFLHYRRRIRSIEKDSRENIIRRLEELEKKYSREAKKAENAAGSFAAKEEQELGLKRLEDYIREHLKKGYYKEDIGTHLEKHGWKRHHIERAMSRAMKRHLEEEIENLRSILEKK
ncbi:MAG: Ig domain-containing protein [Candidatus Woesearchaeota archaeon]